MLKFICIFISVFNVSVFSLTAGGHINQGADYGKEGTCAYIVSPDTFDREKFLDPYFLPQLDEVNDKVVLDAGCGPGHWSVRAAQHGAKVYAIDINEKMIAAATQMVCDSEMANKISLDVGDVASLPYRSDLFDVTLSINVACNIPSSSVYSHFKEMHRTLKKGGLSVITVPTSLDVVFTNCETDKKMVLEHVHQVLNDLPDNPNFSDIYSHLMQLNEVVNATFAMKNNRLVLITDKNELQLGQQIWRKLPALAVPNYYHTEEEYLSTLNQLGYKIEKIEHPHFHNETERLQYNAIATEKLKFGPEYVQQGPYAIYHLRKKDSGTFFTNLFEHLVKRDKVAIAANALKHH